MTSSISSSRSPTGSGSTPRERRQAEFAALLHDVGKVKIPAEIINKPGPLDDDEWQLMKTHTILGEQMLEPDRRPARRGRRIVRSCHERWDGSGYPDALAGEAIPLAARIVCACDAWSAMTTDRSYRDARSDAEAARRAARLRRHAFRSARRRSAARRRQLLTRGPLGSGGWKASPQTATSSTSSSGRSSNLYRVTPLAAGENPAGPPVAYVRQKKLAIKEDIRFYADEGETQEIFRIKARNIFDIGGARYDVFAGEEKIGVLEHQFRASLLRSTWIVRGADEPEVAVARERSLPLAIARRVIDFVPDIGEWIPIPYHFDLLIDDRVVGTMNRKFQLRDRYVLDLSGDHDRRLDRRLAIALAIGLDTLQNR